MYYDLTHMHVAFSLWMPLKSPHIMHEEGSTVVTKYTLPWLKERNKSQEPEGRVTPMINYLPTAWTMSWGLRGKGEDARACLYCRYSRCKWRMGLSHNTARNTKPGSAKITLTGQSYVHYRVALFRKREMHSDSDNFTKPTWLWSLYVNNAADSIWFPQ